MKIRPSKTSTFDLEYKKYCIYCGEIAKYYYEWDEYEKMEMYYCECPSAIAELKYKKKFEELEQERKKEVIIDEKAINKLKYNYELKILKNHYKIK
jgi:hypothetical protein